MSKQHDKWFGNIQLPEDWTDDGEDTATLVEAFCNLEGLKAYVCQLERGDETGRLHLQFTLQWNYRIRKRTLLETLKTQLGFEAYCNELLTSAGIEYSMKADSRVAGPWQSGSIASPRRVSERKNSVRYMVERMMNGATPDELQLEDPIGFFRHGGRIQAFYKSWTRNQLRKDYVDEEE